MRMGAAEGAIKNVVLFIWATLARLFSSRSFGHIALFYYITGLPKAKPRVRAVPAIGYSNFNRNIPWQVPISQRPQHFHPHSQHSRHLSLYPHPIKSMELDQQDHPTKITVAAFGEQKFGDVLEILYTQPFWAEFPNALEDMKKTYLQRRIVIQGRRYPLTITYTNVEHFSIGYKKPI